MQIIIIIVILFLKLLMLTSALRDYAYSVR